MSNPLRGEATLAAGGIAYTLVYDINALCMAQEAVDVDIDVLLEEVERGKRLSIIRALLWAGLARRHSCSLLDAGDIMTAAGVKATAEAVRGGLVAAFPAAVEDAAPANPPPPAAGTSSAG